MNGWGRIVTAFYVVVVGSLNGVFAALIATLGAKEGAGGNILQDIWQLHRAVNSDAAHNAPEPLVANLDDTTAFAIKVSAERDGSFTVVNARNGQSKKYGPRPKI